MIRRISTLAFLGLAIGGIVGVMAVGFVEAVLWLNHYFHLTRTARQTITDDSLLMALTVGIPTLGGLIVGLISKLLPGHQFHGPQDVIEATQSADPSIPVKTSLLSTLAAGISLGSGASVGQYGPLAHMGASIGSWTGRLLKGDRSLGRISIACGAAAAISAAFHAPIAGLVFSREVILRHYSLRAFAPIAVASILGYVVDHVIFGRAPLFRVGHLAIASPAEYLVFIGIGVTGALIAVIYMRAIEAASALATKLDWPIPIRTALAGLALGIVALEIPDVLGIGLDVLRMVISGETFAALDLTELMIGKLLMTALCLGFGFAGGVFSPALLIGTVYGALIGTGADWMVGDHHSPIAVYAVCGMVAVTGPVIGAPLTAVLIVFELTQNFDLATAALASVAFANLVGFRIYGRSYFDVQLKARGFDFRFGRDKVAAQQRTIRHLVIRDFTRVTADTTLLGVSDTLIRDRRSEAYVVDAEGAYLGTLTLHRLMELAADGIPRDEPAHRYAAPESLALGPEDSIWAAMSEMEDFVGESIPVVDDKRLVGVLYQSTIVSAYLEVLENVRQEEHAAV